MTLGFTFHKKIDNAMHDLKRYDKPGDEGVILKTRWGYVHIIGKVVFDSERLKRGEEYSES